MYVLIVAETTLFRGILLFWATIILLKIKSVLLVVVVFIVTLGLYCS